MQVNVQGNPNVTCKASDASNLVQVLCPISEGSPQSEAGKPHVASSGKGRSDRGHTAGIAVGGVLAGLALVAAGILVWMRMKKHDTERRFARLEDEVYVDEQQLATLPQQIN
jgi:hypothetical protein